MGKHWSNDLIYACRSRILHGEQKYVMDHDSPSVHAVGISRSHSNMIGSNKVRIRRVNCAMSIILHVENWFSFNISFPGNGTRIRYPERSTINSFSTNRHMYGTQLCITIVPADALAHHGARPPAGTVSTIKLDIYTSCFWSLIIWNRFSLVIQFYSVAQPMRSHTSSTLNDAHIWVSFTSHASASC